VLAQNAGPEITQEYFVQQATDEALLIRIDAFEAEFESRISGDAAEEILHSGISNSRIAPVFQYVSPPSAPRQLGIEVVSNKHTGRSTFELQLTRLTVWDDRSNAVSSAYQMLSFGMQMPETDNEASWTVRIGTLINAGKLFEQYGMNEMRLWSKFLAAHLVHYRQHDYSISYRMSREILAELNVARLPDLELAGWQLHSAALRGLKRSGALPVTAQNPDPVQRALTQTARLAQSMDALQAQAQALDDSGSEYAADGYFPEALERFEAAIEIADAVGDSGLSRHSREAMVEIHGRQGDDPASSEVLQQIETRLAEREGGDDLALNLLAQARLFIRSYRYPEAHGVLTQALAAQNNSAIRRQLDFDLARVAYETGRMDEALVSLQRAGATPHDQKRPNSVLDNRQALSLLAAVQRARRAVTEMRDARRTQGLYDPDRDHYLYQQGMDQLALGGAEQQTASAYFRQSMVAARRTGNRDLADLALLQYCALESSDVCTGANIDSSFRRLQQGAVPRHATEAMYLHARILAQKGQAAQAINSMDALLDEIHFQRHTLPGVLGGWYFERHRSLFDFYIELLVTTGNRSGAIDETSSLLALSKMRLIDRYDPAEPGLGSSAENVQSLRAQLAERVSTPAGNAVRDNAINQQIESLRQPFRAQFAYLTHSGIKTWLRGLAANEVLLTYHLSEITAQVWVARKGRVTRRAITAPRSIHRQIQQAAGVLSAAGETVFIEAMDRLGERLLDPVSGELAHNIYWIPAGPLLGLPLDALRLKGHYLAEKHHVINLLSFPSRPDPASALQTGPIDSVFVAGYPQDYSGGYATRFVTTDEIRTVMDLFVGPGLHVVQGAALLPDEFQDQRFRQASLAHLAMPGVIDLGNPASSSLELSGSEDGPRRTPYRLEGFGPRSLDIPLVLLSSTRTTGRPPSAYSSTLGLAVNLTEAGAGAVIADLWAGDGNANEAFLADFYRELQGSGDVAASLQNAKRQYLRDNRGTGLYGWAGYQLFMP
jgi:CHAT domain-containing protein/tetratricopeptide (TPR) repeat protein